jgi:hypothetical protein
MAQTGKKKKTSHLAGNFRGFPQSIQENAGVVP